MGDRGTRRWEACRIRALRLTSALIVAETEKWATVIKFAGIKPE
jgi:hypothetical protein